MGKFRLSVHRKNEVRKKYGCLYWVRIPRDAVSVLKVSIPLDKMSFRVSLPLHLYSAASVTSVSALRNRIQGMKSLPRGM